MSKGVNALVTKLRELFDITHDKPGFLSVQKLGGSFKSVALELSDYTLGDCEIKKLFEAKDYAGASGFYATPRNERESTARHYFVFYF